MSVNQPKPVPYKEISEIFSVPAYAVDKVYLAQKNQTFRITFCEDVNDLQDCRARCAVTLDINAFKALAQMLYVKAMEIEQGAAQPVDEDAEDQIVNIAKKRESLQ